MKGVLHFWSETGTEGGHWTFQDENFITQHPTYGPQYDYRGMHVLKDGDELTIFDKDDKVLWQGTIKLKMLPLFTEHAFGYWIHNDQEGISRAPCRVKVPCGSDCRTNLNIGFMRCGPSSGFCGSPSCSGALTAS